MHKRYKVDKRRETNVNGDGVGPCRLGFCFSRRFGTNHKANRPKDRPNVEPRLKIGHVSDVIFLWIHREVRPNGNPHLYTKACGCASSNGRSHLVQKKKPDIKKKSKFIPKKVAFGNKLLKDMTPNEVEQEICNLLKINALGEIENEIKEKSHLSRVLWVVPSPDEIFGARAAILDLFLIVGKKMKQTTRSKTQPCAC